MIDRERWLCATMVELADVPAGYAAEAGYWRGFAGRLAELLGPAEVGLLLADEGERLGLVAASSDRASELSLLETRSGTGPCTSCYQTGRTAINRSLAALAGEWPEFAVAGQAAGFRYVSTLPMRRRHQTIGVLGVLGADDAQLSAADANVVQMLAEASTVGILQQRALRSSTRKCAQLQQALDSRVVIEQAKGALAARLGTAPEAAFTLLRSYARSHNRILTDVAREILSGALSPAALGRPARAMQGAEQAAEQA